jgi:hypothetical protein
VIFCYSGGKKVRKFSRIGALQHSTER